MWLTETHSGLTRELTQPFTDGADAAFLDETEARKHKDGNTFKRAQPKQAC